MRADRLEGATPPGLGTSFDAKNRSHDRTDAARTTRGRRVGGVRAGNRRGGGFVDTKRNPVRQCVISLGSRGKNAERRNRQAHTTLQLCVSRKRRLTHARRRTSRRVQYHKHGLVVRARALSGTLVDSPGYRWEVRRPSRTRVTLSRRATPRAESDARAAVFFYFFIYRTLFPLRRKTPGPRPRAPPA